MSVLQKILIKKYANLRRKRLQVRLKSTVISLRNFILVVPCIVSLLYVSNWRDAFFNSLFIVLQNHPICFGYLLRPSSGLQKTVVKPLVQVMYIGRAATSISHGHAKVRYLPDRYRWLVPVVWLQFYVLLMMGAKDTLNM